MDIPQEVDDYIKETIEDSLGLEISTQSLQLKLRSTEEAQRRLRDQCLFLLSKLKEKDQIIERSKAEANMNAAALKRFVEENQKLAAECANLLTQCNKWERECSLYDRDREALMDFGNEADERAKKAEIRAHELEEELRKLTEELRFYKHHYENQGIDSSSEGTALEENLLESVLSTLISKDEVLCGRAFLEANSSLEACQKMLKMLRPSTRKILSLAAEVKTLEKDKEHLRMNLCKAEDEVKVLFEENNILDEANKRLLRQYHKEKNLHGSDGKHSGSASTKVRREYVGFSTNKRKSSPKICSPIEKKIDFTDPDSARKPLSPLRHNSPDLRMHK
ncbi:myocardial zonula adherens protein [Gossypium australe]|uniref:Myocardial zonula adherens protein n=1 Tax=Gossypium australe TaxID=47621 RepID=A0A5B6W5W0_9ROSI|nr:myocardial zonula adherens protein [Gossypium australe]